MTRYDQETKDRVVRMFTERREEASNESHSASYRRLHELTGIPIDPMRSWVDKSRINKGDKPGLTTAEREEIKALKKEVAELKRANEILKEVEDGLVASLRFAGGILATITATTSTAPGLPHRLEIYGTRGNLQIEGEHARNWQLLAPERARVTPPELRRDADPGASDDPRGISVDGHVRILRDFVLALRERRPPAIDGGEGKRSVALIDAIYRAAGVRP